MPTYNAALRGAIRARRDQFETDRKLALMTAFFAGRLAQVDFEKSNIRGFEDWYADLTTPRRAATSAERIAAFRKMQALGFAVRVSQRSN